MTPEVLTTKEAARMVRVSPLTLWRWHKAGLAHPIQIKARGRLRWPRHEVERLIGKPPAEESVHSQNEQHFNGVGGASGRKTNV